MRDEHKVAILGICAIFLLEGIALYKDVDGTMFGTAMAAVGAIVGYVLKSHLGRRKKKK